MESLLATARVAGGSPTAYVRGVVDVNGIEFTWLVGWDGVLEHLEPSDRSAVVVDTPLFAGWEVGGTRIEHRAAQQRRMEIMSVARTALDSYRVSLNQLKSHWLERWTFPKPVDVALIGTAASSPGSAR